MYNYYRYYAIIGLERYTRKVEISRDTYVQMLGSEKSAISPMSRARILTKEGFIDFIPQEVKFIELVKEDE